MSDDASTCFMLPDLQGICVWKPSLNPHLQEVASASSAEYLRITPLKDDDLGFFKNRGSELLAGYTYPYASAAHLRTACDFINLLYTMDSLTDKWGSEQTRQIGDVLVNTLRDEEGLYDDGSVLCRLTRSIKAQIFASSSPAIAKRFVDNFESYVTALVLEVAHRAPRTILDVETYTMQRRENSAIKPCLDILGYMLDLELPQEVFVHPTFQRMYLAAMDMVVFSNDLYSYNVEQEYGLDTNNLVTVLQHNKHVSLQDAANLVGEHFRTLYERFEADKASLPTFGSDVDAIVSKYITGMEAWVSGGIAWSFEAVRFFGDDNSRVKETLMVYLSPRKV